MKRALLLLLLLPLAACVHQPPQEQGPLTIEGKRALWQSHQADLTKIDAWQIGGKLGLRSRGPSGSATLLWLQRKDYYDMRLSGPLGQGATRLTGYPGKISLDIAGQGLFEASSPEDLVEQQLGWRLPVSHLLWWVRGLPAPDSPSRTDIGDDGWLRALDQDGWHVTYESYMNEGRYHLPERLQMEGRDLVITVVIKEWRPQETSNATP